MTTLSIGKTTCLPNPENWNRRHGSFCFVKRVFERYLLIAKNVIHFKDHLAVLENGKVTQSISDLPNLKPSILISNLNSTQQVTITYGNTDNPLKIPLSTVSEASKLQPIGNKVGTYDTSKPILEDVKLHSDICAAAIDNILLSNEVREFEDSKIQTEVMGKSTASEGSVRNICPTTNDQMSFAKETDHHSNSFGSSSDKGGGLAEHFSSVNSCSESVEALRPRQLSGKLAELYDTTSEIKQKHRKNRVQLHNNSTSSHESEEIKTAVPFKRRLSSSESTNFPESNRSSSKNLEHITSSEFNSLTDIPVTYKIDSVIDLKSNFTDIDSLCSVNLCQNVFCKDELGMFSNPNPKLDDDSTSGKNSYNVKINQNNSDCRPTSSQKMEGRAELIRASIQKDVSSTSEKDFHPRVENMLLISKLRVECLKIHSIIRTLLRKHFEMEHRIDPGKTKKTSVTETESSEENKYQMAITLCKEQKREETKVKIIKEDKNSELEALNSSGEDSIQPKLEGILKIRAENEHVLKNLSNNTEEVEEYSDGDFSTNETGNENVTDSREIDDNDFELVDANIRQI
ncbi:hypothetical protein TNCT_172731 [Trichonephila clavata]|uniref:Uncharacterized protein n=1 Tax=Trichonephila clavata TaxID=2740835 RepID=A0A8X6LFK8_TRICU|nr:hypothetical protein TNCT_172731 [Trichonephila clavata]